MYRIDVPTAIGALPVPTTPGAQGYFTGGNPGVGTPATIVSADWLNLVQEEIMNVVLAAGETPSKTTNTQLLSAISTLISSTSGFPGLISGFAPSPPTGTNTTAAVTIALGEATDSTKTTTIIGTGFSWAVANGNAANGYQGGTTLPNSSTIHFFAMTGTAGTASFASTSLAPTLPSGYTKYRRIISTVTNSSGALVPFTANELNGGGLMLYWSTLIQDVNVSNLTTSRTLYNLTVPTGIKVRPKVRIQTTSGGTDEVLVVSPDEPTTIPNTSFSTSPGFMLLTFGGNMAAVNDLITNTAGQLAAISSSVGGIPLAIYNSGFIDERRS
jgi:hypothetical protein